MTREEARSRRKEWGEWLLAAWGVGVLPNLLVAFGFDPDGWGWQAARIALSVPFLVMLLGWLAALVRERRTPR